MINIYLIFVLVVLLIIYFILKYNRNNSINTFQTIQKPKISLLAIFKNETLNLKIWLEHYIWQGVEKFYLIDNDSSDNPLDILQPYIDNNIVVYYYLPEKYKQLEHYRHVFDQENLINYDGWLIICDLDEFFYGYPNTLINTINYYDNYDVIYSNWKMFGSDNLIEHPEDIRKSILFRDPDNHNPLKYIFKPNKLSNSSQIHVHQILDLNNIIIENDFIRLNHYPIQSLNYFTTVKMSNGDVNNTQVDNIRDMNYFIEYDQNKTFKDDTLALLIQNEHNYKNIQIVVSRYNEDLNWLKDEPFNKYNIVIYNKGINDDFYKNNISKIVKLDNVGRCDHTYLYHIIENYDNLADITIFLPGSSDISYKIDRAKQQVYEVENNKNTVFIGYYTNDVKNDMYDFSLDEWKASDERNLSINNENKLLLANPRPFGEWYNKHFNNIKINYIAIYSILGISKKHIQQHPKTYYENLIQELNTSSNPEAGHYFERSWNAVFYPLDDAIFLHA